MMPVSSAPAATPRMGFVNITNSCLNSGTSRSPATEPDMVSMPYMSVAKLSRMVPLSFLRSSFENMCRMTPIRASIGVNDEGLRSWINTLWLSMPASESIHAVTVVPMFAPMMTLIDWLRDMSPELTKPTAMTVVADDD